MGDRENAMSVSMKTDVSMIADVSQPTQDGGVVAWNNAGDELKDIADGGTIADAGGIAVVSDLPSAPAWAAMNPTSMPNSHLNKNQVSGRILVIEDKVRKVCGDGSFRETKFKQTNSCFDATEPINPRIRPGAHYQTHVVHEDLPSLHANGELIKTNPKPNPEHFLRGHSGSGGM